MGPAARPGVLVGRREELSTLRALGRAQPGSPAAAIIVGDPGMGKSRLLVEAADILSGRRVLHMVGFEPERQVPLGAAVPFLRHLGERGPGDPPLQALLTERDPPLGGLEPVRLFEATYRSLCEFEQSAIVIDDLQWLDELSRALAHYVMRAALADGAGVLMVCATRPSPDSAAFAASIRDLFTDRKQYVELTLAPLASMEGAELAQALRPDLSSSQARTIWSAADGSPFWITLAVRADADPEEPSAAIPGLLRTLSTDAAACLAAVVVGARPVESAVLTAVLAWPEERVTTALSELVNRGIVSSFAGLFRTAHDLVREAALKPLPDEQARRLHRQFADVLRHRAEGDLQALMEAFEHERAGGAATTRLALEIARSPQRRVLGQSGLDRLAAVAELPNADGVERLALDAELAALAEEIGDHESALGRLTILSASLPTGAGRAAAALSAARHALELGRTSETATLLERARHAGGDDPWMKVGADALEFNRLAWLEHDAHAAEPFRVSAISAARDLLSQAGSLESLTGAARQAYAEALDAERVSRLMADEISEVLAVADELVEATRDMGERHLDARLFLCVVLRFLNRWPEAEDRVADVMGEAHQQVYPGMVAYAAYERALVVYHLGRVAEARSLHEDARRLGERLDASFDVADTWLCGLRSLIEASAVDWMTAVASLRQQAELQPNPHCRLILNQRAALCSARFAADSSHDLVVALVDAAQSDARAADCVRCSAELQVVAADALARVGEGESARDLLRGWDARWPSSNARAQFARLRAGAALAAVDDDPEAPALFGEVIASARAAGTRLEELWGLIDLGTVLAERERAAATELWKTAAQLATELGAVSELALVGQRLRAVGVRRLGRARQPAPGDSPVAGLSRRELDVACLAVRGARNVDIADTLFISPKTVEQHISRVFAKLGVHNRAELGSRFGEQLHAAAGGPEK